MVIWSCHYFPENFVLEGFGRLSLKVLFFFPLFCIKWRRCGVFALIW
ncbi:unnamed protein product [Tuber aestivum]|uniref:Uncharacterized protein n=1 Tax=Tuber aestivum TaxID=59557 RepID=A0A292Q850_9PEZI|nr:unnamed protein product [Tuber aestivum]